MIYTTKDLKTCKICGKILKKYFQQYQKEVQGFVEVYKRCPQCSKVYKIVLR
jgi:uncharacterized protein with PIN domain